MLRRVTLLRRRALLGLLLSSAVNLFAQSKAGPQWKLEYFYDEIATELQITGLAFPSATHGVAAGSIVDRKGNRKPKPTSLITSDGGAHWTLVPLPDTPRSLFFLDEANGWMVGREAFWFTADSGRTWTKLGNQLKAGKKPGEEGLILRVAFLDPRHGFAVGLQKSVFETSDGGRAWTPVGEAAKPSSNRAYSSYTHVAFADNQLGMIVGGYAPPRKDGQEEPDWADPERALRRRQAPTLTLEMETRDGGTTWSSATAPLLGSLISLSLGGSNGLGVFAYADSFAWPSEVYRFNLLNGNTESVFKQKDRRVTDAVVYSDGRGFLGAVEPPGQMASAPIPGKVRILRSANLADWQEMTVDYRAVAGFVTIAGPDQDHVWAATDTGMILQLNASPVLSR
jgi:hypothetical protein